MTSSWSPCCVAPSMAIAPMPLIGALDAPAALTCLQRRLLCLDGADCDPGSADSSDALSGGLLAGARLGAWRLVAAAPDRRPRPPRVRPGPRPPPPRHLCGQAPVELGHAGLCALPSASRLCAEARAPLSAALRALPAARRAYPGRPDRPRRGSQG